MLENIKVFELEKNTKKLEIEVIWGYRYNLYIRKIKIGDKEFNLAINKCELMKTDKQGDFLRIDKNIKNKELENLVEELTGNKLTQDYLALVITKEFRHLLDNYIQECNLIQSNENNKAKIEKEEKEKERVQKLFEKAKETGQMQEIDRWIEPCNDPHEECNIDQIIIYAMPDGRKKKERYHTW